MIRVYVDLTNTTDSPFAERWRINPERRGLCIPYTRGATNGITYYGSCTDNDELIWARGGSFGSNNLWEKKTRDEKGKESTKVVCASAFSTFPKNASIREGLRRSCTVSRILTDDERDLTVAHFVNLGLTAYGGEVFKLYGSFSWREETTEEEIGQEHVIEYKLQGMPVADRLLSVYTEDGCPDSYAEGSDCGDDAYLILCGHFEYTRTLNYETLEYDKDVAFDQIIRYKVEKGEVLKLVESADTTSGFSLISDLSPGMYAPSSYENMYKREYLSNYDEDEKKVDLFNASVSLSNWAVLYLSDIEYDIVRVKYLEYTEETEEDEDDTDKDEAGANGAETSDSSKESEKEEEKDESLDPVDREYHEVDDDTIVGTTSLIDLLGRNKIASGEPRYAQFGEDIVVPVTGCSGMKYTIDGLVQGHIAQGYRMNDCVNIPNRQLFSKGVELALKARVKINICGVLHSEDATRLGLTPGAWHFLAVVPTIKNSGDVSRLWYYSIVTPAYTANSASSVTGSATQVLWSDYVNVGNEESTGLLHYTEEIKLKRSKDGKFYDKDYKYTIFGNPYKAPADNIYVSVIGRYGEHTKGATIAASEYLSGMEARGGITVLSHKDEETGEEIDDYSFNVYSCDGDRDVAIPIFMGGESNSRRVLSGDSAYYGYVILEEGTDTYVLKNRRLVPVQLFQYLTLMPTLGLIKKASESFFTNSEYSSDLATIKEIPDRLFRLHRWCKMVSAFHKGSELFVPKIDSLIDEDAENMGHCTHIDYGIDPEDTQAVFYGKLLSADTIEEIATEVADAAMHVFVRKDVEYESVKRAVVVSRYYGYGREMTHHLSGNVEGDDNYGSAGKIKVPCYISLVHAVDEKTYETAFESFTGLGITSIEAIKALDERITALETIVSGNGEDLYMRWFGEPTLQLIYLRSPSFITRVVDASDYTPVVDEERTRKVYPCAGNPHYPMLDSNGHYIGGTGATYDEWGNYLYGEILEYDPDDPNVYDPDKDCVPYDETYTVKTGGRRTNSTTIKAIGFELFKDYPLTQIELTYFERNPAILRGYEYNCNPYEHFTITIDGRQYNGTFWFYINSDIEDDDDLWKASGTMHYLYNAITPWGMQTQMQERDGRQGAIYARVEPLGMLTKRDAAKSNIDDLLSGYLDWDADYAVDRLDNMAHPTVPNFGYTDSSRYYLPEYRCYCRANDEYKTLVLNKGNNFKQTAALDHNSGGAGDSTYDSRPDSFIPGDVRIADERSSDRFYVYTNETVASLIRYEMNSRGDYVPINSDSFDNYVCSSTQRDSPDAQASAFINVTDLFKLEDNDLLGIPDGFKVQSTES